MNDMPGMGKLKSFWERPEGKTGILFAAGGIIGALVILMKWGAVLVAAATNGFILLAYILLACGIGYVLMDPKFRASASFLYKALMRMFTGWVIEIDPINILKSYIEEMEKNHTKMGDQITKLKGTIRMLQTRIKENLETARSQMALAEQAKKKQLTGQIILRTNKAGRLEQSNRTYSDLLKKIEVIYRVLAKMYENTGILIEDTKDQIEQKETEWKTIRQANSAMRSAMSIINGDKDKRAIYEQALEYMAQDIGNKVGEMERFIELSENFMQGVDLQNGVFEEKGMKMLEEWEKNADSWLLGSDKAQIVAAANDEQNSLDVDAPLTVPQASHANQFSKIFD